MVNIKTTKRSNVRHFTVMNVRQELIPRFNQRHEQKKGMEHRYKALKLKEEGFGIN